MDTASVQNDTFEQIEEKIRQAVDVVGRLRSDREAAQAEARTAREERQVLAGKLADADSRIEELTSEVESLREERTQIRRRIEKLLSQIELLGAG